MSQQDVDEMLARKAARGNGGFSASAILDLEAGTPAGNDIVPYSTPGISRSVEMVVTAAAVGRVIDIISAVVAFTVSGDAPGEILGDWAAYAPVNGRPSYRLISSPAGSQCLWDGTFWYFTDGVAKSADDVATPDLATNWTDSNDDPLTFDVDAGPGLDVGAEIVFGGLTGVAGTDFPAGLSHSLFTLYTWLNANKASIPATSVAPQSDITLRMNFSAALGAAANDIVTTSEDTQIYVEGYIEGKDPVPDGETIVIGGLTGITGDDMASGPSIAQVESWIQANLSEIPALSVDQTDASVLEIIFNPGAEANELETSTTAAENFMYFTDTGDGEAAEMLRATVSQIQNA